jgi:hypothetical protein
MVLSEDEALKKKQFVRRVHKIKELIALGEDDLGAKLNKQKKCWKGI